MAQDGLTFEDLVIHVAEQLGVAYYGTDGDEAAQPPTDTPTLTQVKNYVNGGIRMFLNDAPPEGWRFLEPTDEFVLWADAETTVDGQGVYDAEAYTTLTVDDAFFTDTMVGHSITFEDSETSYVIYSVTSSTVAVLIGDASGELDSDTISITANGNYTLPSNFGGEYLGDITYTAATNAGVTIRWDREGNIRRLRENVDSLTGYPSLAAVRKMDATNVANRWELCVYPTPSEDCTVEFPYAIYFTALSADADVHPAGAQYDETVKAACEAYAELHGEDILAGRSQYYEQKALPGAYRKNRRSAPKRLGNLLTNRANVEMNQRWRDRVRRPDVTTP